MNDFEVGKRPATLNRVRYEDFRASAKTGMLGLAHIPGSPIQPCTQSDYAHIFVIGWNRAYRGTGPYNSLMLAESNPPYSQLSSLRWRAKEQSGNIDIYRLRTEIAAKVDFDKVWWQMNHFAGQNYPESWVARDLLAIATGRVISPIPDSDEQEIPRHCSGAAHWAFRTSGMPRVTDYDYLMFPASGVEAFKGWADPSLLEYVCTPILEE